VVKGVRLGFVGHGFELINQNLSIKLSGDLCAESVDRLHDLFVFQMLEKLAQGPGPVQPFRIDLDLLAVVSRDDVVNSPDIAAWVNPDRLA
jgi:hypothetical protein